MSQVEASGNEYHPWENLYCTQIARKVRACKEIQDTSCHHATTGEQLENFLQSDFSPKEIWTLAISKTLPS